MEAKIEIIKALSRDLSSALTIREISKIIKKSYGFTNKVCWQLIKEDVLLKKNVGASILCTLNYKSEISLGLLIVSSVYKGKNLFEKYSSVLEEVKTGPGCIIEYKEKLYSFGRGYVESAEVIVIEDLTGWIGSKKLSEVNVIYGYEKFWRLIGNA